MKRIIISFMILFTASPNPTGAVTIPQSVKGTVKIVSGVGLALISSYAALQLAVDKSLYGTFWGERLWQKPNHMVSYIPGYPHTHPLLVLIPGLLASGILIQLGTRDLNYALGEETKDPII